MDRETAIENLRKAAKRIAGAYRHGWAPTAGQIAALRQAIKDLDEASQEVGVRL